jgi:subtilisin family serine protease
MFASRTAPLHWLAAAASLTLPAFSQLPAARRPAPQLAAAPAPAPGDFLRPAPADDLDAGPGERAAATLSDDVPPPQAAVYAAGETRDVLVQPAGGDPYFLAFAGGAHYPAHDERIDPLLLAQIQAQPLDGRPAHETYAFAMFSKRITPERVAQLEELGARVLGFHPHYTLKLALPIASLDSIAALDFVRWLGVPRAQQKVHPRLTHELAQGSANRPVALYVNVYDSDLCAASTFTPVGSVEESAPGGVVSEGDLRSRATRCQSNGWQQRSLEAAGVEVLEYVERIRAFRCRVAPTGIEPLVELDFVQFVEPDLPAKLEDHESSPLTLVDETRADYDGGAALAVTVGLIDSGIDTAHQGLDHTFGVGWNYSGSGTAYTDLCEHGSHVAGILFGRPPSASAAFTGVAPGLGSLSTLRIRNVKQFDGACAGSGTALSTLFSNMRGDYTDGSGNVSPKPHVVSNSYGSAPAAGVPWVGSEANPRTIDAEVWDHEQLYVFGVGNYGVSVGANSIGSNAAAKNALSVGSVLDHEDAAAGDPGVKWTSSSTGPLGDGRWKPNVVAPGRMILSVDANSVSGYKDNSGTSMATPHVAGLAAQLADHRDYLRYAPHRLASLIMTTAIPFADENITTQAGISATHLNSYGAGRINALNAHWEFAGVTERSNWGGALDPTIYGYSDFTVDAGCIELVVVMTYHEDQCSAGAAQALVNDYDLYLDSPQNGIDPAGNAGEYTAQQSSIDNTELRTFVSPQAGTWRWKVWPDSATGSIRYSVTVQQIFDDTTPNGTLDVVADDTFVKPNDDVVLTATVTNPQYFATAVFLDSTASGDTLQAATTTLHDGVVCDLTDNQTGGRDITLGSLGTNDERCAEWVTRWATEGVKTWSVEARSDTWVDESDSVQITVDGTPPSNITNLQSTTHTLGVWSNASLVALQWTAATDALSGIDGYSRTWTEGAVTAPDQTKDIEQVTALNTILSDGEWYFSIKAVDNCGNWFNGHTNSGAYRIDTAAPQGPFQFDSPTHNEGVLSCETSLTLNWIAAADSLSGLAGYVATIDTNASTDPTGPLNLGANATSFTQNIGSSTNARYAHLRARDVAGNWGATRHFGPIFADANLISSYCTGKLNSLGCTPTVSYVGSPSKSAGDMTVLCSNVISQKNGLMFWGFSQAAAPFQGGTLCVQPPLIRTPLTSSGGSASGTDCTGAYAFTFTTPYYTQWSVDPGEVLHAQFWMRDPQSPSTTGLSNALRFVVCE